MAKYLMTAAVVVVVMGAMMAAPAAAVSGVDVSSTTYPEAFKCLRGQGKEFAVIRAFQSNGVPDPVAPHTVYNAWAGGMGHVDVYIFPCFSCGNPAGQINDMIDYLHRYNVSSRDPSVGPNSYGTIWLDIEGPQYWGAQADNVRFIQGMIDAVAARHQPVAVYTSESQWGPITGNWEGASHLPLWYAHYDGSASFGDFRPFAGWTRPAIKQYAGTTDTCGASVDLDWY